jgi:hypothetical protein
VIRWALLPVLLLTVSCGSFQQEHKSPVIGVAYAGPARLNLRKEIDLKSGAVATAHHGDKLEIVGQRRRWYKVRNARGIEGWTSDRELLDPAQMQRLKALAAESAGMPAQGVATTFSAINVHTEPSRLAPSFVQVQPNEKVDTIMRKVTGRGPMPKRDLLPARVKPTVAKKKDKARVPPPPAPGAPAPPSDWMQLSQERTPAPDAAEDVPEGPRDDWTLIRTPAGLSGWVLTSSLYLAIPDEVAQYAEGHRITSYFSLGKIEDGAEKKDIWLWTTAEKLGEPWDFDSYRVFVWSLRHHRYETAYIQRREQGYFPVLAKTGEFSVCLAQDDGTRVRKKYTMLGNAVRPSGTEPCTPESVGEAPPQQLANAESAPAAAPEGLLSRIELRVRRLLSR